MQKEILQIEFKRLVDDLIKRYDELGMRASGNWAKELIYEVSETKAVILGENYTEQLIFGRKPGKFPPISAIEKWIKDKGITSKFTISTLAFLIARKIAREGTEYYKQGGTDLVESVITEQRIQEIINKIGEQNLIEVSEILTREFNKMV